MPNSKLKQKYFNIPDNQLKNLLEIFKNFNGDKKTKGYLRLKGLLKEKKISYENMKVFKHFLDKNPNDSLIYKLHGGDIFHNWVNDSLNQSRNTIDTTKSLKQKLGDTNAYIKSHDKERDNVSLKPKMARLDKSMTTKDIADNNVNYENTQWKKVVISEEVFNKIFNNKK